jgi:hypothetical protein
MKLYRLMYIIVQHYLKCLIVKLDRPKFRATKKE